MKKRKVTEHERELQEFVFGKDITASSSSSAVTSIGMDVRIDRRPSASKDEAVAAWQDDDDANLTVNLQDTSRLRKFRKDATQKSAANITGTELSSLLQER